MRRERRQRLHHMWVLRRRETRAYTDHILVNDISLLLIQLAHCGPSVQWRATMPPGSLPASPPCSGMAANPGINAFRFQRQIHMATVDGNFPGLRLPVNAPAVVVSTSLARNVVRAGYYHAQQQH